ncbi:CPCC family cysteine-rich protein [Streptomyces sedi]|uniref:CPCC family cysteine-rich protein n=1 Tax=Streptomyces sedi TaxID=555059 RepID=UPI001FE99106|nr:CPCC family cysteine-rich protein [Streptomyces sedi]
MVRSICYWEDDLLQLRWPLYAGGANGITLADAQQNYLRSGVSDSRFSDLVRAPRETEVLDVGFRVADLERDNFEPTFVQEMPWPSDRMALYWWRPHFWRRDI